MPDSPFAASDLQQGAKRRSFPGGKSAVELGGNQISVTASTSQPAATLFTSKQASWYVILSPVLWVPPAIASVPGEVQI